MKEIGIFGGSFNPPHKGHINLIENFLREKALDYLIVIPAGIPPHKELKSNVSREQRMKMCELTFKDIKPKEKIILSSYELEREGKSYTVRTLKALKEYFSKEFSEVPEFNFLIGDDMLFYFHKWYKPEEILKLTKITVGVREKENSISDLKNYAKTYFKKEYENNRFEFLKMDAFPVSSTEIREKIHNGEDVSEYLTEKNYEYIKKEGLYV